MRNFSCERCGMFFVGKIDGCKLLRNFHVIFLFSSARQQYNQNDLKIVCNCSDQVGLYVDAACKNTIQLWKTPSVQPIFMGRFVSFKIWNRY